MLAQVVRAADSDVNITVEKKRIQSTSDHKATDIQKRTETWAFTVTVENQSVRPLQNLDAKYIIFYKTEKLGEKGNGKKATKNGDSQIASIQSLGTTSFVTDSVTLTRQSLIGIPGGYTYFGNGAKATAEDTITGIWVRLYNSDGSLFAEYAYPEGLTSSEQWQ